MKNKIFSSFFIYCLILSFVPVSASEDEEVYVHIWNPLHLGAGLHLTFGHASITVGSEYLSFCKGHISTLSDDSPFEVDNVFRINSSLLDVTSMKSSMSCLSCQSDKYNLFSTNCTFTVAQVLKAGGLDLGDAYYNLTNAPTPYRLRDELLVQFAESPYVLAAGVKGGTEREFLQRLENKSGFILIDEGKRRVTHRIVSKDGRNLF
jgi:hypothetical protein